MSRREAKWWNGLAISNREDQLNLAGAYLMLDQVVVGQGYPESLALAGFGSP